MMEAGEGRGSTCGRKAVAPGELIWPPGSAPQPHPWYPSSTAQPPSGHRPRSRRRRRGRSSSSPRRRVRRRPRSVEEGAGRGRRVGRKEGQPAFQESTPHSSAFQPAVVSCKAGPTRLRGTQCRAEEGRGLLRGAAWGLRHPANPPARSYPWCSPTAAGRPAWPGPRSAGRRRPPSRRSCGTNRQYRRGAAHGQVMHRMALGQRW